MGIKVTYRPLFQTNLWHAYYLHPVEIDPADQIGPNVLSTIKQEEITGDDSALKNFSIIDDLAIIPTTLTQKIMARHKMVFRKEKTGFSVWIQVDETGTPLIELDRAFKLSFYLQIKNRAFFNFTNIRVAGESIYYFSNRADNLQENSLFLNTNSGGNTAPTNYISANDLVDLHAYGLDIDVSAQQLESIRFVLQNSLHEQEFLFEKIPQEDFLSTCQFPIGELPAGLYELTAFSGNTEIPELNRRFYWPGQNISHKADAVIELFFLSSEALGPYAFLNDQQQVQNPVYTLWWQNRSTHWRYLFEKDQAEPDADDADCNVRFETANDAKRLISKEIQPLVHRYRKIRYRTAAASNNEEVLLPNPRSNRIYPEGDEVFSEIYMGNMELNKIIQDTNLD